MKMNKFAAEVHQNAVEHGWWDEERSFGEIIALCHSELSEALEEYRAKRPMVYFVVEMDDGKGGTYLAIREDIISEEDFAGEKPEGIAVELADCIIRILDWFGKEEMSADDLMAEAKKLMMCDVPARIYASSLGDCIARWHLLLSLAYSCWCRASGTYASALRMALCICEIQKWAKDNGVDMEKILDIKHEYNKGRPYRHGGKAL